jgi:hypothetical protein
MHQFEGLCFLVFAERGLWNRFVPSLDGPIRIAIQIPGEFVPLPMINHKLVKCGG